MDVARQIHIDNFNRGHQGNESEGNGSPKAPPRPPTVRSLQPYAFFFCATAANVAAPHASGISTGCPPYKNRGPRRVDQPPMSCTIAGGEFFSDAGFEKEGNKRFLRLGIGGLGPGSVEEAVLIEGLRGSQVEVLNLVVFH
ncbi:hypothetical protein BHE74_00033784 [Ensete ventricosum]|nr:hypothetical protein BHE74_00033784 [Ensete ventricosum]